MSARETRISVVVPAWNAGRTIACALESLIAQTHDRWEAVVVDDGSEDDTSEVVQKFCDRDPRIRLIRQENSGEAGARNAGIAVAHHDWLLCLDADDWIAPQHLACLTAELEAAPDLDAVHCGYARVAGDGTLVPEPWEAPAGDMFAVWARRSAFPIHACVVRRSLVEDVGGFDTTLCKSADWDLWQRVARTGARFGAVRQVLAFYRMQPNASSLDASQMLIDGLRVIRRGHASDSRVLRPQPEHASGVSPEGVSRQAWYLLSWCAGLMIGRMLDARPLIEHCDLEPFSDLHAPAVAQCLFDAAPLPLCESPKAWPGLWPRVHANADRFLEALEEAAAAPGLARAARGALVQRVLRSSPAYAEVADELTAAEAREQEYQALKARHVTLQDATAELQSQAQEAEAALLRADVRATELQMRAMTAEESSHQFAAKLRSIDDVYHQQSDQLRQAWAEAEDFASRYRAAENERATLWHSPERQFGDLVLNRFRLRRPIRSVLAAAQATGQAFTEARLRLDRFASARKPRMLTTVCWNFPIHSQTFVYQELVSLMDRGVDLRLVYSKAEPRRDLHDRFDLLWPRRRRLYLTRGIHERSYRQFKRRLPARVDALIELVGAASGMSPNELVEHPNFLEAFTFARMAEAYRPQYLHSYFFYDRSLMALVASYLLNIPRGISCYADHLLDDYELKVVPLHLEMCDVVVATSERIRSELLQIAPSVDPQKIIVKPNGIDTSRFPVIDRTAPGNGSPFRVVSVSRLEAKKGLIELVEAIALLRERGVAVEAHVLGEADAWNRKSVEYGHRLDRRIGELDLWGTVHLEGRQDLAGILHFHGLAHAFVAPYVETAAGDKDGIPTALLEGMSTGLPGVGTDAGSIREVIDHGRNGLIVPQREPSALADAIEDLVVDPSRRARMASEAASTVRARFDVASCEAVFHDRALTLIKRMAG